MDLQAYKEKQTFPAQLHNFILGAHAPASYIKHPITLVTSFLGSLTISPLGASLAAAQTVMSLAVGVLFGAASIVLVNEEQYKAKAITSFYDMGFGVVTTLACLVNIVSLGFFSFFMADGLRYSSVSGLTDAMALFFEVRE